MRDLLASADLVRYGKRHETRFGLQSDNYLFSYDINAFGQDLGGFVPEFQRTERPRTVAVYLEDEWTATDALSLRGGLRVLAAGERGTAWMPRLGARYEVTPSFALSLGLGRYAQVFHSMRDEESLAASLMAYDMVTTVPTNPGLTTADDVTLGAEWNTGSTQLRVDAYVKRLHNLPLPPIPDEPLSSPVLVPSGFRIGTGSARGLEILAGRTWGERGARLAYAFAFAEREVDGERFPARFERRHTLDLSGYTPLGKRGLGTARLALATGQPYTPVIGIIQGYRYEPRAQQFRLGGGREQRGTILLGEHNAERLPGYLRLDIGARKEWDKQWFGRTVTLAPYVQILNVLNSPNVLVANPNAAYSGESVVLEYVPQFPIFPTFGVEWRF
jgi:outer membrane receptor protein involved in Fe transport